jgi:hypothetical protein
LLTTNFSNTQNRPKEADKTEIEETIQGVIDGEYTRIPNKDFDAILESKLSNLVNAKINTLIGLTIGLISLLSLFSIFQFNRSRISNEKLIEAEVNTSVKESIKDFQNFYKENIETKLNELEKKLEQNLDFLRKEMNTNVEFMKRENMNNLEILKKDNISSINLINDQISKAKIQVSRAEEYIANLEIQNLDELINKKNYKYPEDLERAKNLLDDLESTDLKFQIPRVVNLLSYIYYDQKMYNEVNVLISKHENEHKLKSNTYINGALTAIYDYHNFNTLNQRNKAIEYLDKSLELTRGYGEALGLKLEIYMMDFVRAIGADRKKQSLNNASKVLHDILNGENKAPAYETVSRLVRDYKIKGYKQFISPLFKELPEQMNKLFQNANDLYMSQQSKGLNLGLQFFDINQFIKEG